MLRFVIRRREKELSYAVSSAVAILVSIILSLLILLFFRINPIMAFVKGFLGPLITLHGWASIFYNGLILLLCGVGLVIAFRAGVWNIGAEGQLLMGAIAATWVAIYLIPDAPPLVLIPAMFALGFVFGGLWGLIAGILKSELNVNEVLSTMMLNYVAYQLVYYLVMGPWANPLTNYPVSKPFPENAWLLRFSGPLPISLPTLIIGILMVIFTHFLLFNTKLGYEIRAVGSNPDAARAYGISQRKVIVISMFLSGGMAGLAGVHAVAGGLLMPQLRRPEQISRGFGFIAILVAWLAGINPIPVIFTSILMGLIFLAGYVIQVLFARGLGVTNVFTGVMLLVLSIADTFRRYRISIEFYGLRRMRAG